MRRWTTLSLTLATLLAVAAPAAAQGDKGILREREPATKWALLIGVNDYVNVSTLNYCVDDIHALRRKLVAAGFPQDHVFTLADDSQQARNRPLQVNIERHLNTLLGTLDESGETLAAPGLVEEGDLVVVAFSGHGVHLDGTSYLCPTDTDLERVSTLVSVERIYKQLELSGAAVKLVIVDACRNDPRKQGGKGFERTTAAKAFSADFDAPPTGILVLSSCAPGQRSWEDTNLAHGVFMHFVVDGLGGAADKVKGNRDNQVSLLELYGYAAEKTKTHVAGMVRSGLADGAQTPRLKGEIEGDFSFGAVGPKPLTTITNSLGMELTLLPRGDFTMGSHESPRALIAAFAGTQPRDFADEFPAHAVRLTHPFYLGRHEVMIGQFREFVDAIGYETDAQRDGRGGWGWDEASETFVHGDPRFSWRHNGYDDNDKHPVVNVSWNDAVAFCRWLSEKEGKFYHLPSEAQWEYACRAGTTSRYSFGDNPEELAAYGNIADGTARDRFKWKESIAARDGYALMSPVGSFQPNAWGLYDMHGNVQEWCGDWYSETFYRQYADGIIQNPIGDTQSERAKVIRGGAWSFEPRLARSSQRYSRPPTTREDRIGFRVARMP